MAILEEHATCSPPTLSVSLLSHPIVTRTGLLPVLAVLVALPALAAFMYPQALILCLIHSYCRLSTGFAVAAFIDCRLTVSHATKSTNKPATTNGNTVTSV